MSSKFNRFLTGLFCLFLGGMLVLTLVLPDADFSPLENRYLQQPPKLSLSTLQNGKFMADAEDYAADHVPARDFWVALKAWCERLSGKQENNGVYFAAGSTLINHLSAPDMEELAEKLSYVNALSDNVDVPVYFGIIPTSAGVWRDRLPAGAPTADEAAVIGQLNTGVSADGIVDVLGQLTAHAGEDVYYRTDHHWTSLGAYYGYCAVMQAIGLEPVSLSDYQPTNLSNAFYGTIFSSSGVRWVAPDTIHAYVPEENITVTNYFNGTPTQGELYMDKYLSEKDKYSCFLGGNQPLCVLSGGNADGEKVLVIRDSYSDAMAPFLAESFAEVHLYDLRYNRMSVKDYVEEHGIDRVVVLYNLSNFITDGNLFLLAR